MNFMRERTLCNVQKLGNVHVMYTWVRAPEHASEIKGDLLLEVISYGLRRYKPSEIAFMFQKSY